jgi:hypothetical protein
VDRLQQQRRSADVEDGVGARERRGQTPRAFDVARPSRGVAITTGRAPATRWRRW